MTSARSNDIDFFDQYLESMLLRVTIRVASTPEDCFSIQRANPSTIHTSLELSWRHSKVVVLGCSEVIISISQSDRIMAWGLVKFGYKAFISNTEIRLNIYRRYTYRWKRSESSKSCA